ncbi:protein unc-93 homolog A isoform X2 [Hemitrygon akajei]|uniref:protein unc-93 homolog A isoform X2 n=1 Tax=Hemitrygon akajei TaxID=2704970 RepID=UPI003BF96AB6
MTITKETKNAVIVSFGFLLLFTAYGGLQTVQSSLNSDEGLGLASLSVIYAALITSSMFLPPIMIKYFGCKWTIVMSMCCYVTFSIGNFHPSWYTLIPTAVILGLGGAPLWSAKCTYLTICGNRYAEKFNKLPENVVNHYFGIFFLIFQSSAVWGNLMSSLIFQYTSNEANITEEHLSYCGAANCPAYDSMLNTNVTQTSYPASTIYLLSGVYTGVGLSGVIFVAIFLDQLDKQDVDEFKKKKIDVYTHLVSTFTHLKDKRQVLLIVMTMYSGFEQGFLAGDYTKAYVTCALGIQYVGYCMICFGASNSVFSLTFGKLSKYTGRIPLFFYALYGVLFLEHKEAAFSNYRLWESVGFVIAFAYANFLCIKIKLIILLIVLLIGMTLYGVVEYTEYSKAGRGATSQIFPQRTKIKNILEVETKIEKPVVESDIEIHTTISEVKF